ncbi:MAG: sulfurtransferase TusA family protein [Anaerolineae bacterium]|jgi:tRNA 2-thiouridine synthesizing protein A
MKPDATLNAGETACGELIMLIFERMKSLAPGQTLAVFAYDLAADTDISAWCRSTGHTLLARQLDAQPKQFLIQKRVQ